MMRAIPKSLLPHRVTLFKAKEEDRWGNETLENGKELKWVRMEPCSKIVRDKNNAEIQLSATLFFDCKNSNPRGTMFEKDDIISFYGARYRIQTIESLYDQKHLHHYEMGLIKSG